MDLDGVSAMLSRTPASFDALLAGLPDEWVRRTDGPGTWSAYDILGHLTHGDATNWLPRLRLIVEHGAGRTFAPFDRVAMLSWAPGPVAALLDRFRDGRLAALAELSALRLSPDDLGRRGAHPEFGEVTVAQVLSTWVAHDLTHLAQAAEVLARRHRDDVGPYRAYLPALDRVAEAE